MQSDPIASEKEMGTSGALKSIVTQFTLLPLLCLLGISSFVSFQFLQSESEERHFTTEISHTGSNFLMQKVALHMYTVYRI